MIPYRRKKSLCFFLMVVLSLKAAIRDAHAGKNRYAVDLGDRGISCFEQSLVTVEYILGQEDFNPVSSQNNKTAQSILDFRYYFKVSSDLPVKMMFNTPTPVSPAQRGDYSECEALKRAIPCLKEYKVLNMDFAGVNGVSILSVDEDITQPRNEGLLLEIRGMVSNARETYFAGNFEEAEAMLVQARSRYRTIHDGEDSEITYWLTVVRGALSIRFYRTLPIIAPLYAEISQLLSDAKISYDEGLRFINSNRRNAGFAKLTDARRKTREVKLLFPGNEEAGLLELRIDRIMDPDTFNRSFQRRLSQAAAGIKERSLQAFGDLKNLAAINPQYPGMGNILEQAEIAMGYRPPPPNPQDLAKSDELIAAAQAIVYTNNQGQYPLALEQLDQALRLNPYNHQALVLKDRVQIALTGRGTIVLDNNAEREYQRAVQALQRGNPIVALSIVQQLLRNPQYRNASKILELQRRIELVL
jgi:tetratricopeptide (TPR) repeat protein